MLERGNILIGEKRQHDSWGKPEYEYECHKITLIKFSEEKSILKANEHYLVADFAEHEPKWPKSLYKVSMSISMLQISID